MRRQVWLKILVIIAISVALIWHWLDFGDLNPNTSTMSNKNQTSQFVDNERSPRKIPNVNQLGVLQQPLITSTESPYCQWNQGQFLIDSDAIQHFLARHPNDGFSEDTVAMLLKAVQEANRLGGQSLAPLSEKREELAPSYRAMSREEIHQAAEDGDQQAAYIMGRQLMHEAIFSSDLAKKRFDPKALKEGQHLLHRACKNGWHDACDELATRFEMLTAIAWKNPDLFPSQQALLWEIDRLAYQELMFDFGNPAMQLFTDGEINLPWWQDQVGQTMPDIRVSHHEVIAQRREQLRNDLHLEQYKDEQRDQMAWIIRRQLHTKFFQLLEHDCKRK